MKTAGHADGTLPWKGAALMTVGMAAFVGQAGDNRLHRHYAVQIVIASQSAARLYRGDAPPVEGGIVGCSAGALHRLEPSAQRVAILYLEPTSTLGRIAHAQFRQMQVVAKPPRPELFWLVSAAIERSAPVEVENVLRELLQTRPTEIASSPDPRVSRVVELSLSTGLPPALTDAAAMASLSRSRFSHLFARDMGIAYRAFAKWRKLLLAVQAVSAGADLTRAAHEAGFADSAHFSRTFADMFGLAPSQAFGEISLEEAAHEHAA